MERSDFAVLVVEDEEPLRESLREKLDRAGFMVKAAPDIRTAEREIEAHTFGFAILDLVLPDDQSLPDDERFMDDMGGIKLFRRLRQVHESASVIMLTHSPSTAIHSRAMNIGRRDDGSNMFVSLTEKMGADTLDADEQLAEELLDEVEAAFRAKEG